MIVATCCNRFFSSFIIIILLGYKIKKLENEKMDSDKKDFLTGLACRTNQTGQDFRNETKFFISRLRGFLMKKGCKEGGVSL